MSTIKSREYKVMLHTAMLSDRKAALLEFHQDIANVANRFGLRVSGKWKVEQKQIIRFLDTPDHTLHNNGLVLRQREKVDTEATYYTLKCRSADRFLASGSDLASGEGFEAESKLEEDIGAPFLCRTSRSTTIKLGKKQSHALSTVGEAGKLFPSLLNLSRDGGICSAETTLAIVNEVVAHERVYGGVQVAFEEVTASVVAILWNKGWKGRTIAAELSFRIEGENELVFERSALITQRFFLALQQIDWCSPELPTKTQLIYRSPLRNV